MKILAINDLSCVGNNSLMATIVVATALGHQVYPVLSSAFSFHTGFDNFQYVKNEKLSAFFDSITQGDLKFDAIHVGFLTDTCQLKAVKGFLQSQKQKDIKVIVDPIMGDNGSFYALYDEQYAKEMMSLVACADLITPNLTEACLLCGLDYFEQVKNLTSFADLYQLCGEFQPLYNICNQVVITSVPLGDKIYNVVFEDGQCRLVSNEKVDKFVSGTGDIFTAVVASLILNGKSLEVAVERAGNAVMNCLKDNPDYDGRYGTNLSRLVELLK
ncbi:MAG: bifunctional hydroxymethylpyrimidine kinase/phosphomethylpyrimidine kinase [Clostridia bacterium]|nr:bifunctional hydroxymethylpyrimidine kinase/phosphomethylpyrimidine kinase [Clostridia bacterium]